MSEGHIHAAANLLDATIVVVDTRFHISLTMMEFKPGYKVQCHIGKVRATELRKDIRTIWIQMTPGHFVALRPRQLPRLRHNHFSGLMPPPAL